MIWKSFIELGFFIGLLINALLFIPQAVKLYRAKTTKGVSAITFLGFNVIQLFTAVHAYSAHDSLLLIGTLLSFVTCGVVTFFAFAYRLQ